MNPAPPSEFLARLTDGARPKVPTRLVIVAAHPDDEVIGLGAQLARLQAVTLIHVTDGSPRNPADALHAGFSNAAEYAAARRRELGAALLLAGLPLAHTRELKWRDQEAALHLAELARALEQAFETLEPRVVLTHPYEGGHPDHDATAFAVHAACRRSGSPPEIVEMTSYHARAGALHPGEFLPSGDGRVWTALLNAREIELKRRMFQAFATQQRVLQAFPIETERFRRAPRYDFTRPPHSGRLYYEQSDFGMTGARFRELAEKALNEKSLAGA